MASDLDALHALIDEALERPIHPDRERVLREYRDERDQDEQVTTEPTEPTTPEPTTKTGAKSGAGKGT